MRRPTLPAILAAALFALPSPPNAGELKAFVRGSWRSIVEAHARRPVIIHFWGLTCGPCRSEMSDWGRLLAENPDLPLVTINADLVRDDPEAVQAFLAKSGLSGAENWTFDDNFVGRLRYEIDPKWQGEVPITLLIGRNGAIRRIEGSANMAEIVAWLAEEKGPEQ